MRRAVSFLACCGVACLLMNCQETIGTRTGYYDDLWMDVGRTDSTREFTWALRELSDRVTDIEARLSTLEKGRLPACRFDVLAQQRLDFLQEDVAKLKELCNPLEIAAILDGARVKMRMERASQQPLPSDSNGVQN